MCIYIVVFRGGDLFLNLLGGCFVYDAEPEMSTVAGSVRPMIRHPPPKFKIFRPLKNGGKGRLL